MRRSADFNWLFALFRPGASGHREAGFACACAFVFCAFLSVASACSAWERRTDACCSLARPSTDMSLVWGLLAGREPMSGLRGDSEIHLRQAAWAPPIAGFFTVERGTSRRPVRLDGAGGQPNKLDEWPRLVPVS